MTTGKEYENLLWDVYGASGEISEKQMGRYDNKTVRSTCWVVQWAMREHRKKNRWDGYSGNTKE